MDYPAGKMMQPMDTLSQLAMCCSSGCKRRDYKPPRGYFYSPSTALLDPGNGWPLAHNPYGHLQHPPPPPHLQPPPQPYFLLTQPVIIAGNPSSNPTNTITLVHQAQSTSAPNAPTFPSFSQLLATSSAPTVQEAQLQQHSAMQPNVVSSQYAIYQSPAALNSSIMTTTAQATTIYDTTQQSGGLNRNQSAYVLNKTHLLPIMETPQSIQQQQQQPMKRPVTLNSDLFRQLEVIEKQVDLTREMELVERHGIVTTRALDPYSLMPHLTETTLRRYHEHFLFNDDSVIRFIEIIKRPGQTLGLYIRTVFFEDPRAIRGTRAGLVVTKIDSDSPIYNSQVLHVGDEILSINLVDIQGMSLDDVVIIMSMPKRLVLALRIPRERDCLLTANLLQQQQLFNSSIERTNSILGYQQQQQRLDASGPSKLAPEQTHFRSTMSGLHPLLQSNDHQLNRMEREMSQRALARDFGGDDDFHMARPVRVQSALHFDHSRQEIGLPTSVPITSASTSRHSAGIFDLNGSGRPWSATQHPDTNASMELDSATNDGFSRPQQLRSSTIRSEEELFNEITNSVAGDDNGTESCNFRNFELNSIPNFDPGRTIGPSSMQARDVARPSRLSYTPNVGIGGGSNSIEESNDSKTSQTPSTLPRRTLPTRPNLTSSPPQSASNIKQPIISNLRLGDTPEQSSYFSSSIDAINRELKELRRQRMALSNNESSVDSTKAEF